MACDVLEKLGEYTALLDAESTLYVLIWMTITQAGPNEKKRLADESFVWNETILGLWNPEGIVDEAKLRGIAHSKRGIMEVEKNFKRQVLEKMHPYFKPIERCLELLRERLFNPVPIASKLRDARDFLRNGSTTVEAHPDPKQVLGSMLEAIDITLEMMTDESDNAEGAPTSENIADSEENPSLGSATDVAPAVKGEQLQSSTDNPDDPFNPTFALSMDRNNSQPRTLSDLVGDTKLRRRFTKETVRRNVPVKEEALIRTVLKSNTKRSMAAGDPEAQSLAPALDSLPQPHQSRSAGSYLPACSPVQSLGKRSREDTKMLFPTIPTATFYGEPESSRRTWGPPSPKLRKTN